MNHLDYPIYTSCNDIWINKIPDHWSIKRLKYVAAVRSSNVDKKTNENEFPVYLCNYVDVFKNDFIDSSFDFMEASATKAEIEKFILSFDDVIITKDSETPEEIAIPAYVKENLSNTICGYHLAHIKTNKIKLLGSYLFRLFQAKSFNSYFETSANGITRFGLSLSSIKDAFIILPPIPEQQTIAAFLDYKTEQIDKLIEKKEQLLKLLEEKRIALITQAVTKGLDPNAKMKPSGIDWLGDIPVHWELKQLKRAAQITYGIGGEIDKEVMEGVRLLSLPNVTFEGDIKLDDEFYIELNDLEKKQYLLKKGDLLFNWRNGSSNHLAKTAIIDFDGEFTHVSFLLRLRFYEPNESRYFRYLINSLRATGFFSSSKAGVNNTFNLTELSNLFLMIPPPEEQIEISNFLDGKLKKMVSIQMVIEEAIDRLKEYRISLITSAVTGKIDVRDFKV